MPTTIATTTVRPSMTMLPLGSEKPIALNSPRNPKDSKMPRPKPNTVEKAPMRNDSSSTDLLTC
jgi:hypothetical protein